MVTTLTYTSGKLTKVKEQAGRYLIINYGTNGYVSEVDAYTAASHCSQWVKYSYAGQSFGGTSYTLLTRADYIYAVGAEPAPFATYTYQASNVSASGTPLISICRDVRYGGPMKNIQYAFLAGGSYGQLYQEKHPSGALVAQLTVNTSSIRTETRGDGPMRRFVYGGLANGVSKPYLLKSISDFISYSRTTQFEYDANGFLNKVTDANGHITTLTNNSVGKPLTINYPSDANTPASYKQFVYDSSGYHLTDAWDERRNHTVYKLNTNMTRYEIDYPDCGIERFVYNGFAEVTSHTFPSNTSTAGNGGAEAYNYSTTGLLTDYTPPATSSDPAPGDHPTHYIYDAND